MAGKTPAERLKEQKDARDKERDAITSGLNELIRISTENRDRALEEG